MRYPAHISSIFLQLKSVIQSTQQTLEEPNGKLILRKALMKRSGHRSVQMYILALNLFVLEVPETKGIFFAYAMEAICSAISLSLEIYLIPVSV